MPHEVMNK